MIKINRLPIFSLVSKARNKLFKRNSRIDYDKCPNRIYDSYDTECYIKTLQFVNFTPF